MLLTSELIEVPHNALALISMKFGVKQKGLINVSGFHVDPGFRGRLKFAVYNAGVHTVYLTQGAPTFLIWYCDLDQVTADPYTKPTQLGLSDDDALLFQGAFASPAQLKTRLDELEKRFGTARTVGIWALTSLVIPLIIALLAAIFRIVSPMQVAQDTGSGRVTTSTVDTSRAPHPAGDGGRRHQEQPADTALGRGTK